MVTPAASPAAWPVIVGRRRALALLGSAGLLPLLTAVPKASSVGSRPAAMSRGFNLPGWVDGAKGVAPSRSVLARLYELGFRAVRLPVGVDVADEDGVSRRQALLRIEQALFDLRDAGFSVTLDLHPSDEFWTGLSEGQAWAHDKAGEAWDKLSALVSDFSPEAVFPELLNEPPMSSEEWLKLRERLAEIVRRNCPEHTIVWGASRYQSIEETIETPLLADDNAVAAVHYYGPMAFTHQCESWGGSVFGRMRDLPFPATSDSAAVSRLRKALAATEDKEALAMLELQIADPWTEAGIARDFALLAAWSERTGCSAILNEFGALNLCADPASRANWARAVRHGAERNGVAWTYWELDRGFGFLTDRQDASGLDAMFVNALLGG